MANASATETGRQESASSATIFLPGLFFRMSVKRLTRFCLPTAPLMARLFWLALAVTTALTLLPPPPLEIGVTRGDKYSHLLAFASLYICGHLAWPHRMACLVTGLIAYGALIEVLQGTLITQRSAELGDWLADGLGVGLGWLTIHLLPRRMRFLKKH